MNTKTRSTRLLPALEISEGAGVKVLRTVGTRALRHYDPFLLLDYFGSDDPQEYIAGFPAHPHRGFVTLTYLLDGAIEHKDSTGRSGRLGAGDVQWMKAASGIIHSEMPKQNHGLLRGFQLWINLPAANKMDPPEYQDYTADAFPLVETTDYRLKLICGRFEQEESPITDPLTRVDCFDLRLHPGSTFEYRLPADRNSMLYLFEGDALLDDRKIGANTLAVPGDEDAVLMLTAADRGARFLLISGRPLNEPVVQSGPFVMNTQRQIEQAVEDFNSGRLVQTPR